MAQEAQLSALEGWWWGRREAQGEDGCMLMADSHFVQQKLTQHCKAIIL